MAGKGRVPMDDYIKMRTFWATDATEDSEKHLIVPASSATPSGFQVVMSGNYLIRAEHDIYVCDTDRATGVDGLSILDVGTLIPSSSWDDIHGFPLTTWSGCIYMQSRENTETEVRIRKGTPTPRTYKRDGDY